jgi:very-short-patch-repair endonuclease
MSNPIDDLKLFSTGRRSCKKNVDKTSGNASKVSSFARKYHYADPAIYKTLCLYAKTNRKYMTLAEHLLWDAIRRKQLGVQFHRQFVISKYIADFACLDCKLIIEVDGAYHSEANQMNEDSIRQQSIEELGFTVLRFTNEQIEFGLSSVVEEIKKAIQRLSPHPTLTK